jgi:hypothetical protein
VDYGNAGLLLPGGGAGGIGNFLVNTGAGQCGNGKTVSQVLADANAVLSGQTVAGCSVGALNTLADKLNNSFSGCVAGPTSSLFTIPVPLD